MVKPLIPLNLPACRYSLLPQTSVRVSGDIEARPRCWWGCETVPPVCQTARGPSRCCASGPRDPAAPREKRASTRVRRRAGGVPCCARPCRRGGAEAPARSLGFGTGQATWPTWPNVAQRGGKAPSLPGERGGSENLCSEVQGGAGTAGLSPRPGVAARGAGRGRPWLASEILLVSPL